jgi:hypothetical protein
LSVPLKAYAPNPLDGPGLARDRQHRVADPQILNWLFAFTGQDSRALEEAMSAATATASLALTIGLRQRLPWRDY